MQGTRKNPARPSGNEKRLGWGALLAMMAASVAFYILLSLVPMVLVALAIFGYAMGNTHAHHAVMDFVGRFFPAQKDMLDPVIQAVQKAKGKIGIVGLGSLALTATGGF